MSCQVFAAAAEAACSVEPAALTAAIAAIADLEVTTGKVTYAGTNGVPGEGRRHPHRGGWRADVHRGLPADVHPVLMLAVEGLTAR